jgi:hypothetical protein
VVKRKDGKYRPETRWYKVLNPGYSQKAGRQDFFNGISGCLDGKIANGNW